MQWLQQIRHNAAAAAAPVAASEAAYLSSVNNSLQRRLEASERALEAAMASKRQQDAEIRYLKVDLTRAEQSSAHHCDLWSQGEVALARMQRRQDDLLRQVLSLQSEEQAGSAQSAVYNQEVMERFFRSTNQQRAIDAMTQLTYRHREIAATGLARRAIGQWAVQAFVATARQEILYEQSILCQESVSLQSIAGKKRAALDAMYHLNARWTAFGLKSIIAAWRKNLSGDREVGYEAQVASMLQENAMAERSRLQLCTAEERLQESLEKCVDHPQNP